jgi:hypothetical protein
LLAETQPRDTRPHIHIVTSQQSTSPSYPLPPPISSLLTFSPIVQPKWEQCRV